MTITRVNWTIHAEERLLQRGLTRVAVEQAVRDMHPDREINSGAAKWRIDDGRFVMVYDHPDGNDSQAIRIVSVWTKRRRRKRRSSRSYS